MSMLPIFGRIFRPSLRSCPISILRHRFLAQRNISALLPCRGSIQPRCLHLTSKRHVVPTKVSVVTFRRSASSGRTGPNPINAKSSLLWIFVGANAAVSMAWFAFQSKDTNQTIRIWLSGVLSFMYLDSQAPLGQLVPQLFGSLISHQHLPHLLFNMISFASLARFFVYTPISVPQFATLLLGSGLTGNLLWLAQTRQRNTRRRALGASGIVSGIVTSAALLYPSARIIVFVIPMPLWVAAGLYFAADTYNLNNEKSVIGHAAHLGGSLFGIAFYTVVLRRFGGVFPLR